MPKEDEMIRRVIITIAALSPLIAFCLYSAMRRERLPEVANAPLRISARSNLTEVGGVRRPMPDTIQRQELQDIVREVRRIQQETKPKQDRMDQLDELPTLTRSMNANVRNMIEAAESGKNPERLSPSILPKPFNKVEYEANPQAYLDVVEPGRVFQSAQPGRGVRSIGASSRQYQTIKQRESVRLRVLAAPNAPVTFTSFDLGAFENRLPSITKAADDSGWAEATFTGTLGTVGRVNILASSPVTSGRAQFQITVVNGQ